MKKQARYCALFLTLTALATLTASCGSGGDTSSDTTTSSSSDGTTAITAADIIGFPTEDNGDTTIRILMGDHSRYEFMIETETGDIVDDAVYNRNLATEEYLGIKLEFESRPGWGGADVDNWLSLIRNSVIADDDEYQLINGINVWTARLITDGILLNLNEIGSINLDNPWWVSGYPIAEGKVYYAFNDASLSLYKDVYCMFFNKNLIEDLKLENPYEYVLSGTWTVDKFIELAKQSSDDLNGDGYINADTDRISYVYKHAAHRAFMAGSDCSIIDNSGDTYKLLAPTERLFDIYEKLRTFMVGNSAVSVSLAADYGDVAKPFIEGRSLFMTNCLCTVEYMRNMQDDYGLLPMPKYDADQENYRSQVATSTSAFYIPITAGNPELVGKTCEVLGYYSREEVIPAYYEVALKDKFSRDETTREIVDIIRESATTSFESAYSALFSVAPNDIMNIAAEDKDLASYYESNKNAWKETLDSLIEFDRD